LDKLKKLLSTSLEVTKEVYIKRLDEVYIVKGVKDEEFDAIEERATYYEGKGNKSTKKFNKKQARYMTIAHCLIEPNLNDNKVLNELSVDEGWQAVPKLFLPGEQTILDFAIGECSGYTESEVEEAEVVEEVKN
jgi:hypothetical protein